MEFDTANHDIVVPNSILVSVTKRKNNLWLQYMRGRCKIVSVYNWEMVGKPLEINIRKNCVIIDNKNQKGKK